MAAASSSKEADRPLAERLRAVLLAAGFELVLCEHLRGGQILRLFIDRAQDPAAPLVPEPVGTLYKSGITLDHCRTASTLTSQLLADEPNLLPGEVHLEVSSPGIERPLRTPRDFARFVGHRAHFKLRREAAKQAGARAFEADVGAVQGAGVVLRLPAGPAEVAFADIERARLVAAWPPPSSRKDKQKEL